MIGCLLSGETARSACTIPRCVQQRKGHRAKRPWCLWLLVCSSSICSARLFPALDDDAWIDAQINAKGEVGLAVARHTALEKLSLGTQHVPAGKHMTVFHMGIRCADTVVALAIAHAESTEEVVAIEAYEMLGSVEVGAVATG